MARAQDALERPDLRHQAGEHVGLANVARRLESFYGPAAGLAAAQRDGRFTVDLRLPLELTL